jgi:Fe-Mn family superoxide dismutase
MFTLSTLNYEYNALEPVIDEATMRLHHTKHHQTYLDKLNASLESQPDLAGKSVEDLLVDLNAVPETARTAIKNNGGGFYNHNLWWESLTPVGSNENNLPEKLAGELTATFGSVDEFKAKMKTEGLNRFGSGWVWLVKDQTGRLIITSTTNQDSPLSVGQKPLLGIDLWEHSYYLQYQNRRADYLDALWSIINWKKVAELANI